MWRGVAARRLVLLVTAVGALTFPLTAGAATRGTVRTIKLRGSTPHFPAAGKVSHGSAVNVTEDGKIQRWNTRSDSPRPATKSVNGKRALAAAATPSWLPSVSPTTVHAARSGLTSWEGLNEADNDRTAGFSLEPPDQGLCAGNGYVFEAINDVVRVYNRGGTPRTPVISLNAFFGYPEGFDPDTNQFGPELTDPSCLYDAATGRFYVAELTLETDPATGNFTLVNHVDIAVSKTSNPTGGWNFYSIPTTDTGGANGPLHTDCPCIGDFPHIGADSHGFFVTTNEYPWSGPGLYGNNFNGAQIYAMSKTALADGAALVPVVDFQNTFVTAGGVKFPGFAIWPTLNPGTDYPTAANGSEYFTSSLAAEEARPDDFNGHAAHVVLWQISNTKSLDTANPALTLSRWRLASESYGVPPISGQNTGPTPLRECLQTQCQGFGNPYQPDAEGGLDSSDSRMLTAWYVNGRVLTALDTAMTVNGSLQAGPAWFSIRPAGSSSAVTSQGYVGVAGNNVIYPSIATTSAGTGAVALTLSGSTHFPSAAYATWGTSGPGDVWTAKEGAAPEDGFCEYTFFNCAGTETPQIRPRWGDYGFATYDGRYLFVASEYIAHSCTFATFSADPTCGGTRSFYGNFSTRITRLTP
jgi:hypothetical protein